VPTTREALLAEALGDLARLLERAEALRVTMDGTQAALQQAGEALTAQAEAHEKRMALVAEAAKGQVARFIAQRADEAVRQAVHAQTPAPGMVGPSPASAPRQRITEALVTHLAAAALGAAAAWSLALYVAAP
jgi:hypothetical protein